MDTTLLVNLDDQWQQLDIYEDIPISLMIQELDIRMLDVRKGVYSKQFVIPNTSNNANIFEHYFEVNGIDFNPLTRINCIVQYRGTDLFNGLLRLSAVVENPTHTDYEVYIMGEVGDFASEIRNLTIQDLNWNDLQHELTYSAITKSWEAKNNDVDGLFGGKILYPLINYGLPYQGTTSASTPSYTYSFGEANSFDQSINSVPEFVWKPSIRLKEVIDRIFARTGYQVDSEFLNSDYFKSMYMDTFQNGKLGVTVASGVTNQNIFKTYMRTGTIITYGSAGQRPLNFDSFRTDGYDPLNNFKLGPVNTGRNSSIDPPNPAADKSLFLVPFNGNYSFNFRFNFDDNNQLNGNIFFQIYARKSTSLLTIDNAPPFAATDLYELPTGGAETPVNWFFTGNCGSGEYVKLYVDLKSTSTPGQQLRILPYSDFGLTSQAPMWDLYSSPTLAGTQLVDIRLGLQQINCIDFLKAIITMFNLVISQKKGSSALSIEPLNWYYNEDDRREVDWTKRLDHNSTYRIEPLSFDLPKEINLTYTKGAEEYLNKIYEDNNKVAYGRFKFTSTNNLLTGEQEYELPFAATPTTVVNGADNFIIPAVYRELNTATGISGNTIQQLQPYSNKPHVFFWTGNRYCYKDKFKQIEGTWFLTSGATPIEQTTYPCVSHLSSLDIQIPSLISDLNFGSTFDFFGNYNNLPVQFSPYNLWNTFWSDYIENNYSNETRRLVGRFLLRPTDIFQTKLTDKIFVKDSFYRIEKINEASLISNKLTEISLIKERSGYYKIEPPAPYYTLSGNTPYPGVLSAFTLNCYTGTTQQPVCDGTTPTQNLTTFGVSGLSTNQQVYDCTGLSCVPVPLGTYLRYTADTNTYVVINNVGQILIQNC